MKRLLFVLTSFSACSLGANLPFFNNCLDDVTASVDFLWWNARGDELIYAITREGTHEESSTAVSDDLHSISHIAKPQWNPGVRLHAEKAFNCPDIVCFGEYTWYQTTDKQTTDLSAPSNSQSYLQLQSDFLFGQELLSFSRILSGDLKADFYFNMNRLDLGLEKGYHYCEQGSITPFISATYLHTDENIIVKANTNLPFDVIVNQKDKVYTQFDGFGVQLGLCTDWNLFRTFSFNVGASVTGLYGKFSGNNRFKYVSNQLGSSTIKDHFKMDYWTGRIVTDLKIGFSYQTCLCSRFDVTMHVDWELQTLYDQTNWINRAGLAGRQSSQSSANLTLQGFVLGAEVCF